MPLFNPDDEIGQSIIIERPIVYNIMAASAFLCWDAIILFSQEVELIWWSPTSSIKFLYFFLRYWGIAIGISECLTIANVASIIKPSAATCNRWKVFAAVSGTLLFFAIEIVFIMRAHAFYNNSKRVLTVLVVLFICEMAAHIGLLVLAVPHITEVPNTLPPGVPLPSCIYVKFPKLFSRFWIPALVYESFLFAMVMYRFFSGFQGRGRILLTFVRDGTWAFAMLFATLMWYNFAYDFMTTEGEISLAWIYTIISFGGTRVILNLRAAAHDNLVGSTWGTGVENQLRFIGNSTPSTWLAAAGDAETPSELESHTRS